MFILPSNKKKNQEKGKGKYYFYLCDLQKSENNYTPYWRGCEMFS